MAVAFDAVGPSSAGTGFTATPGTWTHVNGGNGITVAVTIFTGASNTVTGVTYGGVTVPLLKFQVSGTGSSGGLAVYGLLGATCPTGSNTVSVAHSGTANFNAGSVSVSGAASFGTAFSGLASSNVTTITQVLTGTTTGGLVVAAACYGGGGGSGVFSGTNSVTVRWQHDGSTSSQADNGVQGTVPSTGGGASQTAGFSTNSTADNWGIVAVEVLPAAGGILPQQAKHRAPAYFTRIAGGHREAVYTR